jgi:hypothetical protein
MSDAQTTSREHRQLRRACRANWGISVRTYRIIKALSEFAGVCLVGGMWAFGSLPAQVGAVIVGLIIFGAELFELLLEKQGVRLADNEPDS